MTRCSGDRRHLRLAVAAVVVLDLCSFFFFIFDARAAALGRGEHFHPLVEVLSRPVVAGLLAVAGAVGAVIFGRGAHRIWAGLVALVALSLSSAVHGQLFGSPWRHLYFSGVCLLGWLAGLTVARWRGADDDESMARVGAIALLGAAYFNSGISKLVYGGVEWLSGTPVQAAIIAQDGLVSEGILGAYRALALAPAVAQGLSVGTVLLELSGPLMLLGNTVRAVVAVGIVAMHVNILVLTGVIVYGESMFLLLVFGLSADDTAVAHAGARPRWFVPTVVALSLLAVSVIVQQERRFESTREITRMPETPAAMPPEPTPTPDLPPQSENYFLPAIGPFAVGEKIAGWTVRSLNLREGGFVVRLDGAPGEVGLIVTCAEPDVRGLFDLDAARVLYSSRLPTERFTEVGEEFRERIRSASEGREICAVVAEWCTRAQSHQ